MLEGCHSNGLFDFIHVGRLHAPIIMMMVVKLAEIVVEAFDVSGGRALCRSCAIEHHRVCSSGYRPIRNLRKAGPEGFQIVRLLMRQLNIGLMRPKSCGCREPNRGLIGLKGSVYSRSEIFERR